jgi:hypothetical protein
MRKPRNSLSGRVIIVDKRKVQPEEPLTDLQKRVRAAIEARVQELKDEQLKRIEAFQGIKNEDGYSKQ